MRHLMWSLVGLVLLSGSTAQAAGEQFMARTIFPGCKADVALSERLLKPNIDSALSAGVCVGAIETLLMLYATASLAGPTTICVPNNVSTGQLVRVVIRYMDARPERLNESFALLAIEAFRAAWPCSNSLH